MMKYRHRQPLPLSAGMVIDFCYDGSTLIPVAIINSQVNSFGCLDVIDLVPQFRQYRWVEPSMVFRHQPDPTERVIGYYLPAKPRTLTESELATLKANCPEYQRTRLHEQLLTQTLPSHAHAV